MKKWRIKNVIMGEYNCKIGLEDASIDDFDIIPTQIILEYIDDGMKKILQNSSDVISTTQFSNKVAYIIDMQKPIGKLGGSQGNGQIIESLLLVLEKDSSGNITNKVINAYPK